MSINRVKEYFKTFDLKDKILEFDVSSATVELAAKALGVENGRIAKTMSFKKDEQAILIVTAGDVKIDNSKYKQHFATKAKMLTADEVMDLVGHAVGGVCPFALNPGVSAVYIDRSVQKFSTVYPACGSSNSAIELSPDELFKYSNAMDWVDVTRSITD